MELTRRNIPFHKYGGLRFLEAAHVKDLISFLRILENPRDEIAWFRVLQLLNGVGPATAAAARQHVAANGNDPCSLSTFSCPPAARDDIAELAALIHDLVSIRDAGPARQIERILPFYAPILGRLYDNPQPRKNDIEHLAQLATEYSATSQFLSELVLDPPSSTGDYAGPPVLDEDWLVLSTIHSAKGLEWDVVYLIHATDGCLPSDMATGSDEEIEEELRLTYVAMTRAKSSLCVLWPKRYYHRPAGLSGDYSYAQRCRFFGDEVVESMHMVGHNSPVSNGDIPANGRQSLDVGALISDLWA